MARKARCWSYRRRFRPGPAPRRPNSRCGPDPSAIGAVTMLSRQGVTSAVEATVRGWGRFDPLRRGDLEWPWPAAEAAPCTTFESWNEAPRCGLPGPRPLGRNGRSRVVRRAGPTFEQLGRRFSRIVRFAWRALFERVGSRTERSSCPRRRLLACSRAIVHHTYVCPGGTNPRPLQARVYQITCSPSRTPSRPDAPTRVQGRLEQARSRAGDPAARSPDPPPVRPCPSQWHLPVGAPTSAYMLSTADVRRAIRPTFASERSTSRPKAIRIAGIVRRSVSRSPTKLLLTGRPPFTP
jgi:hypothetical protein